MEEAYRLAGKAQLVVGCTQRVKGRIALARGEKETAEACLREALLIFEGGGAEYEAGRVRAEIAKVTERGVH